MRPQLPLWQLNRFSCNLFAFPHEWVAHLVFMNTLRSGWMNNVVRFVLLATVKYAMRDMFFLLCLGFWLLLLASNISIKIKSESKWKWQGAGAQPTWQPTGNLCGVASCQLLVWQSVSPSVCGNCSQMEKFELQLRNVEQDFDFGREALGECECECEATPSMTCGNSGETLICQLA